MPNSVNVLFISDIVGQPGISALDTFLHSLITKYKINFVIANGENAHEGSGMNEEIVRHLYSLGVDVITGGNHSFGKWKIFPYMRTDRNLLRPANYPKGAHGYGYGIYSVQNTDLKIGVINLMGRTFMHPLDDPFRMADYLVEKLRAETSLVFVDFHAEATAEKMAMGWYLDGRASAVVGTHTHIPTNDARVLPGGTGYMTDVGMTGSFNSVLGMDKNTAIKRFTLQTPHRYKIASGDNKICAVVVEIDIETGKCLSMEPFVYPEFDRTAPQKPL